tara:strand:+ start:3475 stop:4332 length:858 start_codon:yes stop_codon:yes gene_type:complete
MDKDSYSLQWTQHKSRKQKKEEKKFQEKKFQEKKFQEKKENNPHEKRQYRRIKRDKNRIPKEWHKRNAKDNPKYKTKLCNNWMNTGECEFGSRCVFAHGPNELRQSCLRRDKNKKYTPPPPIIVSKCNGHCGSWADNCFCNTPEITQDEITQDKFYQDKKEDNKVRETSRYNFATDKQYREDKAIEDWSIYECIEWMISKNIPYYVCELFVKHEIDGSTILLLTKEDLTSIGIKIGMAFKLLYYLNEFRNEIKCDLVPFYSSDAKLENMECLEETISPVWTPSTI